MPVAYITADGTLAVPDDPEQPLHEYHDVINPLIDADLHGLTGDGEGIRRIVVSEELSPEDQSAIEEFLGAPIELEEGPDYS